MKPLPRASGDAKASRSIVRWHDEAWLARRAGADWQHLPVSIYEAHLGSW